MRSMGSTFASSLRTAGRLSRPDVGLRQRCRGRLHDGRRSRILGKREQRGQRLRALRRAGMQRRAVVRALAPGLAVPLVHRRGGPVGLAVGVALRAGIRAAERHRQVGTRHADAVVAPRVDHHVVLRRHVALDALRALRARLVEVMLLRVERGGVVAARAQRIAFGAQLQRVRLVAVHAGDAALVHPGFAGTSPRCRPRRAAARRRGSSARSAAPGGACLRAARRACPPSAIVERRAWQAAQTFISASRGGLVALRGLCVRRRKLPRLVPAASQDDEALVALRRVGRPRLLRPLQRGASPARGRPRRRR